MSNGRFTIKQLAEYAGVSLDTVRYYEKIHLLSSPKRSRYTHRYYTEEDKERLRIVRCLKKSGLSLEEIRTFLSLPYKENLCNVPELKEMMIAHKQKIERQIEDLQKLVKVIEARLAEGRFRI